MSNLERAIEIAIKAHKGQVDKAGAPYILHPLRVMLAMDTEDEMMAAVLHDVVEDTRVTLEDLREEGFSNTVIFLVEFLTRFPDEDYDNYILRVHVSRMATKIKIADLRDNLDMTRIKNPTKKDFDRIARYLLALDKLKRPA